MINLITSPGGGGVLLGCYSAQGFIIPTAEAGFVLSEQITLLDLPVGKGGVYYYRPLYYSDR